MDNDFLLFEEELKKEVIDHDFFDRIFKSNYFLPVKFLYDYYFDTSTHIKKLDESERLVIFNNTKEYLSRLGYSKFRGSIFDLKLLIYGLQKLNKKKDCSCFSIKDLLRSLNIKTMNSEQINKVFHSFNILKETTFKNEGLTFNLIDRFFVSSSGIFLIHFNDLLKTDSLKYTDRIDFSIVNKLNPNNSAIRFYIFLNCFENEICFSYNGIRELFFPKTTLEPKMIVATFKRRALKPLYDIGFLNKQKVKHDKKNKKFVFEKGAINYSKLKKD